MPSVNTASELLVEAGDACAAYHDRTVRDVQTRRLQCDVIGSFCYAKAKNVAVAKVALNWADNVPARTATDGDSQMILAYGVGDRLGAVAIEFTAD